MSEAELPHFTPLDHCLACGSGDLVSYLDLGAQPLANSFHDGSKELPTYPLGLNVCASCFHSQQKVAVNPDILYRDYAYASGTSGTLRQYFRDFVCRVESDFSGPKSLCVLDIASNDGSLLNKFAARSHYVQGVDPALNLHNGGIPTIPDFWGEDAIACLGNQKFDAIIAMNVLGHVSDPMTFLCLCKQVLAPGGRIYVQTSQAKMFENAEFDTCYHEHLSFFTVRSFVELATKAGLHIAKISHVPIHGTSYLVELTAEKGEPQHYGIFELGRIEQSLGYYGLLSYKAFRERVQIHVDHVRSTIEIFRRDGWVIAGYGAAAKAMTFLNYAGITLDFIIDDALLKQGKLCPGNDTRVMSDIPAVGRIAWIITAWNFKNEIIGKIKAARPGADDRFVCYFPTVTVE